MRRLHVAGSSLCFHSGLLAVFALCFVRFCLCFFVFHRRSSFSASSGFDDFMVTSYSQCSTHTMGLIYCFEPYALNVGDIHLTLDHSHNKTERENIQNMNV